MTAQLVSALEALAASPRVPVAERVFASMVEVDGPPAVGPVLVAFTDRGVSFVRPLGELDTFADEVRERFGRPVRAGVRPPKGLEAAFRTGRARGVAVDLRGVGEFAQAVLLRTRAIPVGEVRSYGWVAAKIGRPGAVRATGTALGRNPVPFLIPCHRVVRSDGSEGEYLFGRDVKRRILESEHADLDRLQREVATGARYVGSDTTKIVCEPSCRHARRISDTHRVPFRSMAEAAAAGYRPCLRCEP